MRKNGFTKLLEVWSVLENGIRHTSYHFVCSYRWFTSWIFYRKGFGLKIFNPTTQERIELVFLLWEIGTPKEKIINAFRKALGFEEEIFSSQLDYLFDKWEKLRRE